MNLIRPAFKAILVDLDGVLRHWPKVDADIERRFHLSHGAIVREAFSAQQLEPAIRGSVSDSEWRDSVAAALQRQFPDGDAIAAVAAWSAGAGVIDQSILTLLEQCGSPRGIVLITNATSRLTADLKIHGLHSTFQAIVNSSDSGSIKPEVEIFEQAIRLCAADASEIVFIDDDEANVATATRLGLRSHRFKGKGPLIDFLIESEMLPDMPIRFNGCTNTI